MKKTTRKFILQSFEHAILHILALWTFVMGLVLTYNGIWYHSFRQPEKTYDVALIIVGVIFTIGGFLALKGVRESYLEWKKGF